jgi:hypothetical protein
MKNRENKKFVAFFQENRKQKWGKRFEMMNKKPKCMRKQENQSFLD